MLFVILELLLQLSTVSANSRVPRSISSLSEETSNILGELVAAINPVYLVILAVFVAGACAFEVAYASRGAGNTRANHVAGRNGQPTYSVRSV